MTMQPDAKDTPPFASVVICTYNRSRWLKGTLAFATAQDYPPDRWELLVVDNNSTDDTRQVVGSLSGANKAPRYILEPQQGLSHARNRALAEAKGEVIVFLDDDTEGASSWLRHLMAAYAQDPGRSIGIVGGEIIPGFPDGLPSWLEGQWTPLAYRPDLGPLPPKRLPMGANFSARIELARAVGGFRTDLGRKGEVLAGSEDHDFIRRVRAKGAEVWFAPEAVVTHLIPGNRLCFRYAMRHAFDSSRSRVVEKALASGGGAWGWLLSRVLLYSLQAPVCALLALLCFAVFQGGRGKRLLTRSSRAAGYVVECLRRIVGGLRSSGARTS